MADHVVIAGGGFGGLYAARRLLKVMPPQSVKVTLVNNRNFLLYAPLLPAAAGGAVEPRHVIVPLREGLGSGELCLGEITGADPGKRELYVTASPCATTSSGAWRRPRSRTIRTSGRPG
jgi:NADH dehydrogenase